MRCKSGKARWRTSRYQPGSYPVTAPALATNKREFSGLSIPQEGSSVFDAGAELGVLASQCLEIAAKQILAHEVNAWQDHRNKHHAKANWQFKTADARVKLKRLYPQFG
jgi:hypothetical protein